VAGVSEAYLRKGPLDADKSIAETLNGQIVLMAAGHMIVA